MSGSCARVLLLMTAAMGPVVFLAVCGVCSVQGGCLEPRHALSDLGMSGRPLFWVMDALLVVAGLVISGFGLALPRAIGHSGLIRAVRATLVAAGLGLSIAGAFPFPHSGHFVGLGVFVALWGLGWGLLAWGLARQGASAVLVVVVIATALAPLGTVPVILDIDLAVGFVQKVSLLVGACLCGGVAIHLARSLAADEAVRRGGA